jgi:uncharacterized protein (DUF433 family)
LWRQGGKAVLGNTRVRVNDVVFLHTRGKVPQEILAEFPDLSLAQVHSALAYYYDHQAEIDAEACGRSPYALRFLRLGAPIEAERPQA